MMVKQVIVMLVMLVMLQRIIFSQCKLMGKRFSGLHCVTNPGTFPGSLHVTGFW